MRRRAWTFAASLALVGASAEAQFSNPTRVGGNRDMVTAMRPLGRLDCETNERVRFQVNYAGDGTVFNSLQLWVGAQATSCTDMVTRYPATNAVCWPIASPVISGGRSSVNEFIEVGARFLVDPLGGNCATPTTPSRGTTNTNYLSLLVVPTSGSSTLAGMALGVPFDLAPPAQPTNVSARPGEGSIEVRWQFPTTFTTTDAATTLDDAATTVDDAGAVVTPVTTDLQGFWVLCDPPTSGGAADAGASDAADAGASDGSAGLDVPSNVLGGDAGAGTCRDFPTIDLYGAEFGRYQRGSRTSASDTSLQVNGLTNGGSYRCVVVAEDLAGNRTVSAPSACVSPVPVTDFWERYRADGGAATVACAARPDRRAGSRGPLVTLSVVAAALAARRRRRS